MNPTIIRMLSTALFGLAALGLGGAMELTGNGAPEWLVGVIGLAAGYLFGHVQANGVNGKKNH